MTNPGPSRRGVAAALAGLALSSRQASAEPGRGIVTTVFDTAGFFDVTAKTWIVPLHAWVFEPQQSTARKAAIAALFKRQYGLDVATEHQVLFDARINLLLADNKRGQMPQIEVRFPGSGGPAYRPMPKTGANGHTRLEIVYPTEQAYLPVAGVADLAMPRAVQPSARTQLITPSGISIICDIDDTVKDSGVLDKRRLWEATFFKPFMAVAGMAALLNRLAGDDKAVHYVSSSPWHLYQPLRTWLSADGFPVSSLHLKHIRLKDSTILDILKSPEETKPPVISELLKQYPRRRFILVGDSGEKDPEVYGAIARSFSAQVARILIRRAPGDTTGMARFDTAFAGLPRDLWQLFDDPSEVR